MKILKWLLWAFQALVVLGVLETASEWIYPAGIQTKSTEQAHALLFAGTSYELPGKVEISMDGVKAVFHRGDTSYDKLVNLLHNGRSAELIQKAGYPLDIKSDPPCGELVISNYGIPSHFPIRRAGNYKDAYFIWLPKLTSPGHAIPFFTLDPRVIEFIKDSKAE